MLERLKKLRKNIRVGIIGMGAMGKGLFYQCYITPGFECVAVADIYLEKAVDCLRWLKKGYEVIDDLNSCDWAVEQGKVAVCTDGDLVARCEKVDVLIEASSAIIEGGQFSETAIRHGKHLILMNAEVDLTFGHFLAELAEAHNLVYSSCDGDQHGVLKHLIDDIQLWGFELVMAGNIKGFLDRYSNPTKIIPEADIRNLDYKMSTAYTDGTKLGIEMALIGNACGLSTLVPGMTGPRVGHVSEVFDYFDFEKLWADRQPFVDYILGAEPGGGVFVIGYCDEPYQQTMMKYYKMGEGPFYLFYRPCHLCHVEALEWVAKAYLDHESLLKPRGLPRLNVFAYAKRDLRKGETLDGIGGYKCYGQIDNVHPERQNSLPICLSEGVIMQNDVPKDAPVLLSDISYQPERYDFGIYKSPVGIL